MPVTARLSKLFYERLGEEIANELVNWFNQVDATYRTELKEFNELNFARFDAKLEQRVAELHAKLDGKLDRVAGELNAKIDRVAGELDAKIDRRFSEVVALLERRLGDQTRWLFVAWASLLIPIIGLWIRG
jgi:hypothetical protein